MVEFGHRLKKLRKERGLTQKQLAEMVGVQNSIISFYEVGDRMPSPEMIVKLAAIFHVSTDYLMGVEKTRAIHTEGLSEENITIVSQLVQALRDK